MTVAWAEPPPIGGPQDPRAVWVERLRPLTKEPGRWALVKSGTPSAMNQTRTALQSRQWNVPPGRWEFTVRTFRRGVHVGDMNIANLYARYLGPGDNAPIGVAADRVLDDEGNRLCEDCGARLSHPGDKGGKWTRKCDLCWAKANPKWLRLRTRRRKERRDARANGTWRDPRHQPLRGEQAIAYMRDVMGIPENEL